METNTNAVKKWKTVAIAAILVAVISLGGLFYTVTKSGAAQPPAAEQPQAGTATEAQAGTEAEPQAAAEADAQAAAEPQATEDVNVQTAADDQTATETQAQAVDANEMLSLWTEDAEARKQLIAYMEAITKEGSPDFIPVERRIAVFDLDGTLLNETDPNYCDYTLLVYRVTQDPDYKDKASEFEKSVAAKIIDQNTNGTKYAELPIEHGQAVASAFKGMTVDEFYAYIQEFKKQPMPGYEGMNRGDSFYEPMLQVVDYLKANDFKVYVVSGTDRFICRGVIMNSALELPACQIIGSDENVVAGLQNGEDGLDYTFTQGDDIYLGGEFIIKNLKMNKVSVINKEIGVKPVLSFGNSTGDASMCNYTIGDNAYKSLAFMVCCDDIERENGNVEKADKMYALCAENNWIPISMKNDWKRIYAEGVTYVGKTAEKQAAIEAEETESSQEKAAEESAAQETVAPADEQTQSEEQSQEQEEEALDNAA